LGLSEKNYLKISKNLFLKLFKNSFIGLWVARQITEAIGVDRLAYYLYVMNNNDVLRRLRYAFDFTDSQMMRLFAHGDYPATREEISAWLKKDDDPDQKKLHDKKLAHFLNGLIIEKRGKREGPPPIAEKSLNNNMIFRKLKIALNYRDEDIIKVFELVEFGVSKHEVSALFRKPTQSQYRECKDQFLRNFIYGLQD
jgi:uncharacterized protein YehS (DUF1456 family)